MPKRITYTTVKQIADRIYASGILPTVLNVKRALNGEGNDNDIFNHLHHWGVLQLKHLCEHSPDERNQQIEQYVTERAKNLENSLSLVRATLESTGDGILVVNSQGQMIDYNDRFLEMWHMPRQVMEQRNDEVALRYVMEQLDDPQAFVATVQSEYQNIRGKGVYSDLKFKDGRVFERYSQPYTVNGEIIGRVWSLRDVTERRAAEQNLQRLQKAVESAKEAIIITQNDNQAKNPIVIYANEALKTITGFEEESVVNRALYDLLRLKDKQHDLANLTTVFTYEKSKTIELACYKRNGEPYWCELSINPVKNGNDNSSFYFVVIITDITDRKRIEAQLIHQATHDDLTKLPNRTILYDRISQAILYAKKEHESVGILFIDIDNFKLVNDSLGHPTGDLLLKQVALRLQNLTFLNDTVGRLSGDEFLIVIPYIKDEEKVINIAQRIMKNLAEPFDANGTDHYLTVSIGISFYPKNGDTPDLLISNADMAVYHAKELGPNHVSFFNQNMNARFHERLKLQNGLSTAIEKNELQLVFQPLLNINTNKIASVEALLRWKFNHTENISPVVFIPIAEETGLILPIGEWVFEQACITSKHLSEQGISMNIAVNVSVRQLNKAENFTTFVLNTLKKHEINPHLITLELTESQLMQSIESLLKIIHEFKKIGLQIAIDDFGTGYSSLSQLKELSANKLKIDKSFIQEFPGKQASADLISTIISLAKIFSLTVVAEGVETKEQLNGLQALSCDEIQGFYFAKPMPAAELTTFLAAHEQAQSH